MGISKDYAFIYKNTKRALNKKEKKKLYRNYLFNELKLNSLYPELVEIEDIKCEDPIFYNKLKNIYKSVPVLKRWISKYLFPINYKKKDYTIPISIINTGLDLLRCHLIEVKKNQTDKQKFMEKLFPKLGKALINPKKLFEAFTDFKPFLFSYGEAFDFTWETEKKRYCPGMLTEELKTALGMTSFSPPPWIFKMQKIGPPHSYPNLKIPGVNTNIPPGCEYGYEPNKWGKPSFIPEEKEEYIFNLENQYTSLCKLNSINNIKNQPVDGSNFKTKVDESNVKVDEVNVKVDEVNVKVDEVNVKVDESNVKVDEINVKVNNTIAKIDNTILKVDESIIKDKIKTDKIKTDKIKTDKVKIDKKKKDKVKKKDKKNKLRSKL